LAFTNFQIEKIRKMLTELERKSALGRNTKKPSANLQGNSLIISPQLFDYIREFNLPIVLQDETDENIENYEKCAFSVKMVNFVDNYLNKATGAELLQALTTPGHYVFADSVRKLPVSETILYALNIITPEEYRVATKATYKLNAVLRTFFERRNCELISLLVKFLKKENKLFIDGRFHFSDIRVLSAATSATVKKFISEESGLQSIEYNEFLNKVLE